MVASEKTALVRIEDEENGIEPVHAAAVEIGRTRAAQEVQAMVIAAKKMPRNQSEAYARIMQACSRPGLAKISQYRFPRGGSQVTGASIRLAEALAQNWGNMCTGVYEIERRAGISTAMSFAWDLETNYRNELQFQVRHVRDTRKGLVPLHDERDIYEMVANMGARRKRACILAVIPRDVIEEAIDKCNETRAKVDAKVPLQDRMRDVAASFLTDFGVSVQMLETYLGRSMTSATEKEFRECADIYRALRDGVADVSDYFAGDGGDDPKGGKPKTHTEAIKETLKATQPGREPGSDDDKDDDDKRTR